MAVAVWRDQLEARTGLIRGLEGAYQNAEGSGIHESRLTQVNEGDFVVRSGCTQDVTEFSCFIDGHVARNGNEADFRMLLHVERWARVVHAASVRRSSDKA